MLTFLSLKDSCCYLFITFVCNLTLTTLLVIYFHVLSDILLLDFIPLLLLNIPQKFSVNLVMWLHFSYSSHKFILYILKQSSR